MLIEPRRWSCLVPARARMHGARRYARRSTHIYVRAATGHLHYSGGVLSLPSSNQHAFPSLLAYSAHAACASRVIRTTVRVALRTVWEAAARAPASPPWFERSRAFGCFYDLARAPWFACFAFGCRRKANLAHHLTIWPPTDREAGSPCGDNACCVSSDWRDRR